MAVTKEEVEEYLESNPQWRNSYILQHADLPLINKWLLRHGYSPITDVTKLGLQSSMNQNLGALSLSPVHFKRSPVQGATSPSKFGGFSPRRSNSRKHLRTDFARARFTINFRTHEPDFDTARANRLAERRCSLKGMRQFHSLPSSSADVLSTLIQSRVRLPTYEAKGEPVKRELKKSDVKDFFHEIIKDISHGLNLDTLTSRILVNITILLDAEKTYLYFIDPHQDRKMLLCKLFDLCSGKSASSGL